MSRLQILQSYDFLPNVELVKHNVCSDICSQNCNCSGDCCVLYQHQYFLFQSHDVSSDDNSCMSDSTYLENDDVFDINDTYPELD